MKPTSVVLASLLSTLTLAGCALGPYHDEDRYRYRAQRDSSYPPERYEPREERGRFSAVQIYTLPGFRGGTMGFSADGTTLDTPLSEGVNSLVIREGTWELCTSGKFEPRCRTFEPGRYERLSPRNEGSFQMVSLRRIG
jgi:hypothetical protein